MDACWLAFLVQNAGIISAVLLTVFTGGLWVTSIWQWCAINKQIKLQTIQWVAYKNWRCKRREGNPGRIQVLLDVVNQTSYPLTIPSPRIILHLGAQEKRFPFTSNWLLTPHNLQTPSVWISLTVEEIQQFSRNQHLQIQVQGDLSFIGVLKQRQPMAFEGILWCGQKTTWFEEKALECGQVRKRPK